MRRSLVLVSCLSFLISFGSYGQVDYEYKIILESELTITDTLVVKRADTSSIVISILDSDNDGFPYFKVKVENQDTIRNSFTDFNGESRFEVPAGEYDFSISFPWFNSFESQFTVQKNEQLRLTFQAISRHQILNVHSAVELSKQKLDEIRQCLLYSEPHECSNEICTILIEI
jgi:hypothetical protein